VPSAAPSSPRGFMEKICLRAPIIGGISMPPRFRLFLGRDPDVGVWIGDPSISRRHACILVKGETAELEDLGSKNGSFHAGRRLDGPIPLRDGEGFRIASVDLVFRVASVCASTATAP
jgi:pSer/pThr/pTyr-binding forkhead associated (FHA) protein